MVVASSALRRNPPPETASQTAGASAENPTASAPRAETRPDPTGSPSQLSLRRPEPRETEQVRGALAILIGRDPTRLQSILVPGPEDPLFASSDRIWWRHDRVTLR